MMANGGLDLAVGYFPEVPGTLIKRAASVTCTSARRTRSSRRRASWSMMGRHFSIGQKRATVVVACSTQCCPKASVRKMPRSIYEEARDVARALAKTEAFKQSSRDRKRVEMLFARLKRILRLGRLRLRGPCGAQFEFTLAAIAQNLAGLPSWSPGHHRSPLCALRKRCKRQ